MRLPTILVLSMMALASGAQEEEQAERNYRTWTDKDGKTITAEYVRTEVESVVLRLQDDTEIRVSRTMLCEEDRKFVMLLTPPRIEINMEPSVDTYTVGYLGNEGYDYTVQYQVVEPSVVLRKTSTDPYDAPLTMEVIILGRIREIDRYLVIDNSVIPFSFTGKQSYEVTYTGYPLDLRQIKGSWRSGVEYEGYLVCIRDIEGRLIAVKASKVALEQNAEEVTQAAAGSMLTRRLKVIQPRIVVPDAGYEEPELTF